MSHGGNVWQGENPLFWQDHSANIRPGGPPQWVNEAMLRGMKNAAFYPEPSGLRAAKGIAEYLGLDASNVVATAGGISAIDMAAGSDITGMVLPDPCFVEYTECAQKHGKKIVRVPIIDGEGRCDPALLESFLFEGCGIWLCNPMNPSGWVFDRQTVLNLLEKLAEKNGMLFLDEAFIDYCREYSSCDLINEYPNLVITGSMTKSLGIPGVRLGYICAQPKVLDKLCVGRRPWEVNCFAEAVAMELPEHGAELQEDAEINESRRETFERALKQIGVFVYPSKADFLLCRFDVSVHKIAERLHDSGILVRECMDYNVINDDRHLRIAVKTEAENMRFVNEIGRLMKCAANR